ncbi:MAG TPA: elongation factor P--(R)-beta-lysine ligase [Methylomirabilota bacterium]|nr:elongation factor P--(R)-beta-lysine ligase [Methylomirabilota bacterium]
MATDWRPTASLETLRLRAEILGAIRSFFAGRGILEVETPLLAAAPVTDLHLAALSCRYRGPGHDEGLRLWLQTSPEFAMKRLLAAGSGPIYALDKAFRDGEAGSRHNPEFTLLEWYRPGWDHHRLMDEVEDLLTVVLGSSDAERLTYAEAFRRHAGVDPFHDPVAALAARAADLLGHTPPDLGDDRDAWLELLLSHAVEPRIGRGGPTFVYDFPASQAALARVRPGDPPVAERFELFLEGVELANGYHELGDPAEQRRRFEADLAERRARGLPEVPVDERLLAALAHGLPDCAGVALGVDRLVMLAAGATRIDQVITFPVDRA